MPCSTQAPEAARIGEALAVLGTGPFAVLTGAGLSTDSGIPDYRGPDSPPRRPMTYQQFTGDPGFRRHYWARNHVGWQHMGRAEPNDGHRALAVLEARGVVSGVVTQNVDTLHHRAGSRTVVELHGRYDRVVCLGCGRRTDRGRLAPRLAALNPDFSARVGDVEIAPDADAAITATAGFRVADCASCGGMLKPDIVFFGENVPPARVARARTLVDAAAGLLVAGSSLTVWSGRRFAKHAAAQGKPVVVINRGPTRGDSFATLKVDAGCSPVLRALAHATAA